MKNVKSRSKANFSKKHILFVKLSYKKKMINNIKVYLNTENIFFPIHPNMISKMEKDVQIIQLFLENLDVLLIIYYKILGNIKKFIN